MVQCWSVSLLFRVDKVRVRDKVSLITDYYSLEYFTYSLDYSNKITLYIAYYTINLHLLIFMKPL